MKSIRLILSGAAKRLSLVAALLVAVTAAGPSWATPLTTPVKAYPDLTSSFIDVRYSAQAHTLEATGFVSTYKPDAFTTLNLEGYTFNLGVLMSGNGAFTGGSLDLFNPYSQDRLLTGQLAALGFATGDPSMQFLFMVTGGSLAADFGSEALVNLNFSGFETATDGFYSDWDNGYFGDGTADNFAAAVPEPSSVLLLLLGAGALIRHRNRKAAAKA